MSFLMSVLMSNIFWIAFFGVGIIAGSTCLRHFCPASYRIIKTGKDKWGDSPNGGEIFGTIILSFVVYLFWPVIIASYVIWHLSKLTVTKVIWPAFCKIVVGTEKLVPDFKIVKDE